MREVNPDRYFDPNNELIKLIDVRSKKLYELLFEIINNDPSLKDKVQKPIDSLKKLKEEIGGMDINKVEWLVDQINKKL